MSGPGDVWVEDDAPTTWALVVGIDRYDKPDLMPLLTGAAADAVAAVRWLRLLGVPAKQILLHAAPSDATRPDLHALDVPYASARSTAVSDSIETLEAVRGGTRLFVFLSGHGLYEPSSGRLFILQDARRHQLLNLGIDAYCKLFLSWQFKRQFLFMDGCQNYPYSLAERQTIEASGPPGRSGFTPDPQNFLIACFAAHQGQIAEEVNGRGALLSRLLPALHPGHPHLWAVGLDFGTGRRTVNLEQLMDDVIDQVAKDTESHQRPDYKLHGAAQSQKPWPVFALPDLPRSRVRVNVKPAEAAAALQSLYVKVREDPEWILRRQRRPGQPIIMPVEAYLPKGLHGEAECNLPPGSDSWRLYRSAAQEFETIHDEHDLPFNLSRPEQAPPSAPPEPEPARPAPPEPGAYARVQTLGPDGQPVYRLQDYTGVAQRLGRAEPHTGDEVALGVTIIRHEDGPEFTGAPSAIVTVAETARAWADAVRDATPAGIAVITDAWGASDVPMPPNVRVVMPPGGAGTLAGPLASIPVVRMTPAGEPPDTAPAEQHSLQELETARERRVEPGPTRVTLTLPWGTWTRTVHVPAVGSATLEFPATVGTPPLRVSLAAELDRPGQDILGRGGPAPLGWVSSGSGGTPTALDLVPTTTADWGFTVRSKAFEEDQAVHCTLRASPALTFPLQRGRTFAVDLPNRRVEPLSATPAPEWDLLVGLGLIDAVDSERAFELIREPGADPLLRLAAGYVLWSAGEFEALQRSGFDDPWGPTLDHAVLTLAMYDRTPNPSIPQADSSGPPYASAATIVGRLKDRARRREIPLFRWGLGLTLNLIDRVTGDSDFNLWRSTLLTAEAGLSGASTWTAYTSAPGEVTGEPPTAAVAAHSTARNDSNDWGMPAEPPVVGIVAAGAGARGPYEAGVLAEILPWLDRKGLRPALLVGTSAGAITAALLAQYADLGPDAGEEVARAWMGISQPDVFRTVWATLARTPAAGLALLQGQFRLTSMLDTTPLWITAQRLLDPARVADNLRAGRIGTVAATTTFYPQDGSSGRTRLFVQGRHGVRPQVSGHAIDYVPTSLEVEHVLASAAIPTIFPPVLVTRPARYRGWYIDGGVRLNAPIKPALALGANHIIVVSSNAVRYPPSLSPTHSGTPRPSVEDAGAQLLHAALADAMVDDLHTLGRKNERLRDFYRKARAAQPAHAPWRTASGTPVDLAGLAPYARIRYLAVGPHNGELARVAAEIYDEKYGGSLRHPDSNWLIGHLLNVGNGGFGRDELLSYLFFDPTYAAAQVQLGREHARIAIAEDWQTGPP